MRFKAALFDLDGTILDSLPLIINTYRKVFTELNIPWGEGDVVKWIGRPLAEIAQFFAGDDHWKDFIELYQTVYAVDHDQHTSMFPGAQETLVGLKEQNLQLGIVTSKRKPATMRSLEFLDIKGLFDVIITATDVSIHKPNPEPVLAALKILGTKPNSAVFIGDSPFDIISGKRAGVHTIGVTWGMADGKELKDYEPDQLLDNWQNVRNVILNDL